MCALLSCVLSTMVFVLRRHIGEYDPDHPVADDEQDGSELQGFVAQPLPPGLEKTQTTISTWIGSDFV